MAFTWSCLADGDIAGTRWWEARFQKNCLPTFRPTCLPIWRAATDNQRGSQYNIELRLFIAHSGCRPQYATPKIERTGKKRLLSVSVTGLNSHTLADTNYSATLVLQLALVAEHAEDSQFQLRSLGYVCICCRTWCQLNFFSDLVRFGLSNDWLQTLNKNSHIPAAMI